MKKRHGVAAVIALVLFACVGAGTASGDPQEIFPVTFTIDSSTCSQLASGQVITGTGVAAAHETSGGTFHASIGGTATDNLGNSWTWAYNQNGHVAADGSGQISDHFNLVGKGSDLRLHSHFVLTFDADGNLVDFKQVTGDPEGCDPI